MVFNVLEALQPSLVSRVAPAAYKGLALGFYNTAQAAGLFTGGALGGWLASHSGANAVFIAAAAWRCSGWPLPGRCGRWPSARAADTPESRGTRRHQARTSGKSAGGRDRFVTNGVGAAGAFRR